LIFLGMGDRTSVCVCVCVCVSSVRIEKTSCD
jgi:hypothetical protein